MAALLEYLHTTQIKGVERLKTVISYNEAQYMQLSPVTRANLELTETLRGREKRGTLLWVLDKTSTAMGSSFCSRTWIGAAARQRCHQPPSGCCGKPGQPDRTARRSDRRTALHRRSGAYDDPHGLRFGHAQRDLCHGGHPANACPACQQRRGTAVPSSVRSSPGLIR